MISLAMIAMNEVLTIERTIESAREYVDEVIVGLDKNSDDGTEEIVNRLADKVISINLSHELEQREELFVKQPKRDWGFCKARNDVFKECDPDSWRLVLDGHEILHCGDQMQEAINEALAKGCDGVEFVVAFEPDEDGVCENTFGSVRLMAPNVRYKNPIHNVPMTKNVFQAHDIFVEHRKQDQALADKQARDAQRAEANIEGLRCKLRVDGDDARSWFYLANTYKENGRWDEAIRAYQEYLKFSKWSEERWHARVNMGTCYSALGDMEQARIQFVEAIEEFPLMAEAYYYLGDLAYKQKHYREAQVWLEKCIKMEQPDCKLFVYPKVYKVNRHDLLSMVYHHLKIFDKAIEQAEIALESTSNERIKKNVRTWREHLGWDAEVVKLQSG